MFPGLEGQRGLTQVLKGKEDSHTQRTANQPIWAPHLRVHCQGQLERKAKKTPTGYAAAASAGETLTFRTWR